MSTTALVPVESMTGLQIFGSGAIDPILERIEREAREEAARLDISTDASRKALASLAYKVARSKTYIDEQGKTLGEDLRGQLEKINNERKVSRERLDALKEEVRKPLTDWEQAEKTRVACHEEALNILRNLSMIPQPFGSADVLGATEKAENLYQQRDWQEFSKRATDTRAAVLFELGSMRLRAEQAEAEARETEQRRAEAAERAIREREALAAKAATEAAERKAAEQARLARDAAEREQKRVEGERVQAEARAKLAEAQRIASERAAAKQAEEAAQNAERDKQAAIKAERDRIAAKARREAEEQERREASARIRRRVLGEISEAIAKLGIDPEKADVIASAMANGGIPHVSVVF